MNAVLTLALVRIDITNECLIELLFGVYAGKYCKNRKALNSKKWRWGLILLTVCPILYNETHLSVVHRYLCSAVMAIALCFFMIYGNDFKLNNVWVYRLVNKLSKYRVAFYLLHSQVLQLMGLVYGYYLDKKGGGICVFVNHCVLVIYYSDVRIFDTL